MCSCISRFKRLALVASAALCCSFEGVGCASAGVSPAACDGYAVLPADDLSREDLRWSEYLYDHLWRRAGDGERTVGREEGAKLFTLTVGVDTLLRADFSVKRFRRGVRLTARDGRRMLWLQYQLMKSLAGEDPRIEASDLPPATVGLRDTSGRFAFGFRGLYTPAAHDADHAGILAADDAETGWGLWGHQLERVLADGPEEVYALIDGERYDGQFCFSADETYRRIEEYITDNFGEGDTAALRFVVAPTDDDAICSCAACTAVGNTAKSATPAVVKLLTRLAGRFPHHTFFTLGYLSTLEPPPVAMPANAGVIVSAMDLPFAADAFKSARGKRFAGRLDRWKNVAGEVYIWDYIQNFDDYLTPFPVLELTARRLRFYRDRGVGGVFLNGSGCDYVPFDDMRTYVLSALMLDPGQSPEALMRRYFAENYPRSGELLAGFCADAERRAAASKRPLNLYGSIRSAEEEWLDAGDFVRFYEALKAVLPTTKDAERRSLHRLLTALSYTRLEIARNHAAEACGFAVNKDGRLRVNPSVERWLAALDAHADFPEMEHINESGLLPGDYLAQWRGRLLPGTGVRNLLLGVKPEIVSKPDEEYKDPGVLTDGVRGLPLGYHYGWHISSGDLEVAFPAGYGADARRFEMSFLELPRHRLRAPRAVEIYKDGALYRSFVPAPDAEGRVFTASGPVDLAGAKRISVRAVRPDGKRVQLAADEIYLIP